MNESKNIFLAIVLSALVLLGWSLVSDRLLPTAGPQMVKVENGKAKPIPQPAGIAAASAWPIASAANTSIAHQTL